MPAEDVCLRAATAADAGLLRAWRNDPEVVAASFSGRRVEEEEHGGWLERVLADPGERLLVVEVDCEPAGQVRLQDLGEGEVEVHVGLARDVRGRGLAAAVLELAAERAAEDCGAEALVARIKPSNERSLRAFAAAGFAQRTRDAGEVLLERRVG